MSDSLDDSLNIETEFGRHIVKLGENLYSCKLCGFSRNNLRLLSEHLDSIVGDCPRDKSGRIRKKQKSTKFEDASIDKSKMVLITQWLPIEIIRAIDTLTNLGFIANRSEYIRFAIIQQMKADILFFKTASNVLDSGQNEMLDAIINAFLNLNMSSPNVEIDQEI